MIFFNTSSPLSTHLKPYRQASLTDKIGDNAFSDRISHFLFHRDAAAPVRDFHLLFDIDFSNGGRRNGAEDSDDGLVMECVVYAISHGVQSLRLKEPGYAISRIPVALIASKMLRELELSCWTNVPGRLSLPNLKTLCLNGDVEFTGYKGMEPFAGLPELEKLTLRECLSMCHVLKAPKLRVLEIVSYYGLHVTEEISAPLLTSFRYGGREPFKCSKVNLPMLQEVYIDIPFNYKRFQHNHNGCVRLHQKCVEMLHQFGNAATASLTLNTLKVLELNSGGLIQQTPPFPNMKCLKVMEGSPQIRTFHPRVMDYLTVETLYFESLKVEIPDGVTVVEPDSDDEGNRYTVKCKNKFSVLTEY